MNASKNASLQSPRRGEFTGRHMLFAMLAFFGVIVTVNMTMAVLAGRTWTGLVVKNSYVASQFYNEELEAAQRQEARGWRSRLTYEGGKIAFNLADRTGQPVILTDLVVALGRPAFEQQDHTLPLRHIGNGSYVASTSLGAGIWAARITGGSGETAYRRDSRLFVSKPGQLGQEE